MRIKFNLALTFILGCMITSHPVFTQDNVRFRHFFSEQGISHISITSICQDDRGFIWIGTSDGLNKFDGYTFTVYKNDPNNSGSLSQNWVRDVFKDKKGNVWIATGGGVDVYDPESDTFTHHAHKPADSNTISHNRVRVVTEDSKGLIWMCTVGGGLNSFDPKTKRFTVYKNDPGNSQSISSNSIKCMGEDKWGNLWIATDFNGINKFDRTKKIFIRYAHDPTDSNRIGGSVVNDIFRDSAGELWFGTEGGGMNLLTEAETGQFRRFEHQEDNPSSLSNNEVLSIIEGPEGNLWIGTRGGVNVFNPKSKTFIHHQKNSNNPYSLTHNSVQSLYHDISGNMWIGTVAGLNLMEKGSGRFKHYKHDPNEKTSLSHNTVLGFLQDRAGNIWIGNDAGLERFNREKGTFEHISQENPGVNDEFPTLITHLYEDSRGTIWIGTYNRGIYQFDKTTQKFKRYHKEAGENGRYLSANNISTICEDNNQTLWVGTVFSGLNYLDKKQDKFIDYNQDSVDLNKINTDVSIAYQDRKGNFWYATVFGGLFLLNRENGTVKQFKHDPQQANSLSNNFVTSIYEDAKGNLWLGTFGGLNLMDREKGTFKIYTEKDGLCNNVVLCILEDNEANLWLSTNKGIARFNPQTKVFRNFSVEDGLQANEFAKGAGIKTQNGEMYFGNTNGFNVFQPNAIKENAYIPPVYITDFQIFNKSIGLAQENSPLTRHINETREITLSYKESVFSFEFAALNYVISSRNQYAYKLENFDKEWNYVGTKRTATYTNLDPDTYIFRVKASNNDGIWNEKGITLSITIIPPWWQTWWFRITAALFALLIGFSWYKMKTYEIVTKNRILEAKVLERTQEIELQKYEIEAQRDNLNTLNLEISHKNEDLEKKVDERTQELQATNEELNASYDELISSSEEVKKSLREKELLLAEVHHRVKNNLALISGLLQMQLFYTNNQEIYHILQDSQSRIKSMALIHEKLYQNGTFANIEFSNYIHELIKEIKNSYPNNTCSIAIELHLEKFYLELTAAIPCGLLLNELLTNAYKHAFIGRDSGQITVICSKEDHYYLLKVSDNGIGLNHDFNVQPYNSMGMKLIQTLGKQLQGNIEFSNNNGTTFKITFLPPKMQSWT